LPAIAVEIADGEAGWSLELTDSTAFGSFFPRVVTVPEVRGGCRTSAGKKQNQRTVQSDASPRFATAH
jgi:hypothetical protein